MRVEVFFIVQEIIDLKSAGMIPEWFATNIEIGEVGSAT